MSLEDITRPADGVAVGPLVWGLGQSGLDAAGQPGAGAEGQDPQGEKERQEAQIRARWPSAQIGLDGRVTKQYFLAGDLGPTFLKLIADIVPGQALPVAVPGQPPPPLPVPVPSTKIGGESARSILGRMLGGREVEVTYIPDFEVLSGAAIADKVTPPAGSLPVVTGAPLPLGDLKDVPRVALAIITAQSSALVAFEEALNQFYENIPQVEIEVKVVEYVKGSAFAFGVTALNATTANLKNLSASKLVQAYTSIFPLRQPVVGGNPITDVGAFTLGGIHDTWELNAVLQVLEANNLADIKSIPTLVVRNGGTAAISTTTDIPFPKAKIDQLGIQVATDIAFKPVGVKMNIIPVIAGTDSVILQIYADVSAVTNFADTKPVVTPVTSNRTAVTTVYLRNNHTLTIGGLTTESTIDTESKVPILGDIPLLGFLFRSTSKTQQVTTVEFHITPRIVTSRGHRVDPRDH